MCQLKALQAGGQRWLTLLAFAVLPTVCEAADNQNWGASFRADPVPIMIRESSSWQYSVAGQGQGLMLTEFVLDLHAPWSSVVTGRSLQATSTSKDDDSDDDEDDDRTIKPGAASRSGTRIPGRLHTSRTVAPHLSPDASIDLNSRTSLGVFGEVDRSGRAGRIDADSGISRIAKSIGGGLSLEYRFGTK